MTAADVTCETCQGTGWVATQEDWPRPVRPCVCVRATKTRQRLTDANLPAKYQVSTFDTYRAYNDTLRDALTITRHLAERYPVPRETGDPLGLLLVGPAGVGKTHLAAACLTTIIERTGIHGRFYKTRDLLRVLRNSYNPAIKTTEAQILHPILTCDLLVLDDLGAERTTEWVDDVMNAIVDTRYSANLPIIATSNFPDVDDPEDPHGLLWRIGFRMQSRLREMCRLVTLDGADYRDMPPAGSDEAFRREWQRRRKLPTAHASGRPARAQLREPPSKDGKADLPWRGGRGGNT